MADMYTSIVLALFWIGVWYAGAWATRWRSPSWALSSVESENSPHWGACTVMSTVNALVCTFVGFPCAVVLLMQPETLWFHAAPQSLCYDATGGIVQAAVALGGQSFAVRIAIDFVLQQIHGLLTLEEAIHHCIFFSTGCLMRWYCMMPLNGAILMSMETSTPFLNYYLFFKSRYAYSADVNMAKLIFGVLFFIFRMIFNTFGAFVFIQRYYSSRLVMPVEMPRWQQHCMVVVMVAGAGLQLYWGTKIMLSLARRAKPSNNVALSKKDG